MSALEIMDALKGGLMWACLGVLLLIAAVGVFVELHRVCGVLCRLNPAAHAAFAVVAIFATSEAQKRLFPPATGGTPVVTPEEIAQGWRLVAETNCAADVYAMPDGVSPSFNWHKRGTFGEWARLDLGGFAFPLGTNDGVVTSFSVFNDGRIRPTPRNAAREICAVGVPMLAMQGASRFWVADAARPESAPYLSKLLTWENFFLNADTNVPVNAQIELFQNGDFTTRSNDVERIYNRVEPFDWDGDGLENTVDPDPLTSGPDAHGTNAEWYNVVCSNVFEAVEGGGTGTTGILPVGDGYLSWREGVNSNAYYFVDVIASNGPAPIYFTGDRESRLGNPVVVARVSETNHVPLLIGVNYAVTSTVPFFISSPDDGFATVTTNSVSNYEVRWPLEFTVAPDGTGYRVSAGPYDPGCVFQWAEPTRSVACSYTTDGGWIGFSCCGIGTCGCSGCAVAGVATLESAPFDLPNVWCGCWHFDPLEPGYGMFQTNTPSVSVSFDKSVVFYEDAYTNAPNDVVAKHSTNTTLAVFACGGESGGTLYVTAQNMGKLVRTDGSAIDFPYVAFVPPRGCVSFSITYEAETHSDSVGDIFVSAVIFPHEGESVSDSASVTVVKVQLCALNAAPLDGNTSRHQYGVGEIVACKHKPTDLQVSWTCQTGLTEKIQNDFWYLHVPIINDFPCNPRAQAEGVSYYPAISVLEPVKYYCENAVNISTNLGENVAGGAGMSLELYIEPRTVCFGNIALEEVPTEEGGVVGYFNNEEFMPYWAHTRERRAGYWKNLGNDNAFLLEDEATMGEVLPPMAPDGTLTNDVSFGWREGAIIWTIPLGWNERGTSGETDPIKTNAVPEHQTFTITPNGTLAVIKAGFFVVRGTNTQSRLERMQQ